MIVQVWARWFNYGLTDWSIVVAGLVVFALGVATGWSLKMVWPR